MRISPARVVVKLERSEAVTFKVTCFKHSKQRADTETAVEEVDDAMSAAELAKERTTFFRRQHR